MPLWSDHPLQARSFTSVGFEDLNAIQSIGHCCVGTRAFSGCAVCRGLVTAALTGAQGQLKPTPKPTGVALEPKQSRMCSPAGQEIPRRTQIEACWIMKQCVRTRVTLGYLALVFCKTTNTDFGKTFVLGVWGFICCDIPPTQQQQKPVKLLRVGGGQSWE